MLFRTALKKIEWVDCKIKFHDDVIRIVLASGNHSSGVKMDVMRLTHSPLAVEGNAIKLLPSSGRMAPHT